MAANDGLKVFISSRESVCEECREQLGRHAWIQLAGERGGVVPRVRGFGSPRLPAERRCRAHQASQKEFPGFGSCAQMEQRPQAL